MLYNWGMLLVILWPRTACPQKVLWVNPVSWKGLSHQTIFMGFVCFFVVFCFSFLWLDWHSSFSLFLPGENSLSLVQSLGMDLFVLTFLDMFLPFYGFPSFCISTHILSSCKLVFQTFYKQDSPRWEKGGKKKKKLLPCGSCPNNSLSKNSDVFFFFFKQIINASSSCLLLCDTWNQTSHFS